MNCYCRRWNCRCVSKIFIECSLIQPNLKRSWEKRISERPVTFTLIYLFTTKFARDVFINRNTQYSIRYRLFACFGDPRTSILPNCIKANKTADFSRHSSTPTKVKIMNVSIIITVKYKTATCTKIYQFQCLFQVLPLWFRPR